MSSRKLSLWHLAREWWRNVHRARGAVGALRFAWDEVVDFVRESLPARGRARFGDIDFDFDHRVNTTSARLPFLTRLRGALTSAYQPTDPAAFRDMMAAVPADLTNFTFVDLGSGKGRTLLMAAEEGFRRVIGVELLPELNDVACENIARLKNAGQLSGEIKSTCADARDFEFPPEPTVLFLFNPFPEAVLREVFAKLENSLRVHPRAFFIVYHNPILEHVLSESSALKKIGGAEYCSIYAANV